MQIVISLIWGEALDFAPNKLPTLSGKGLEDKQDKPLGSSTLCNDI